MCSLFTTAHRRNRKKIFVIFYSEDLVLFNGSRARKKKTFCYVLTKSSLSKWIGKSCKLYMLVCVVHRITYTMRVTHDAIRFAFTASEHFVILQFQSYKQFYEEISLKARIGFETFVILVKLNNGRTEWRFFAWKIKKQMFSVIHT